MIDCARGTVRASIERRSGCGNRDFSYSNESGSGVEKCGCLSCAARARR